MQTKHFDKKKVRTRFLNYIAKAEKEYETYKASENKDVTVLAETGEKLWGALNHLVELKENRSLTHGKEVTDAVDASPDPTLKLVKEQAFYLHRFFYGWVEGTDTVEERVEAVLKTLKTYAQNLEQGKQLHA